MQAGEGSYMSRNTGRGPTHGRVAHIPLIVIYFAGLGKIGV